MACGLEAYVLALQLGKALVEQPWESKVTYSFTTPAWPAPHFVEQPPWTELRNKARNLRAEAGQAEFDATTLEILDQKRKEFHALADKCLAKK